MSNGSLDGTTTNTSKVLWKKYEDDRPDNYVDSKFLESLIVNADVGKRNYWHVVLGALFVAHHMCMVMVLAGTAYLVHYQEDLTSTRILVAEGVAFCMGLVLHVVSECRNRCRGVREALLLGLNVLARAGVLLALTCVLSPIYATLTTSISPDTTVACICILLIVHMYLYDYSGATQPGKKKPTLGASLGLASGMCASVLMATRMKHLLDVVSIIVLSLQLYIAAPYVHYDMSRMIPFGGHMLNLVGIGFTLVFLSNISVVATSWLMAVLLLVIFLCPMWLVRIEKFKAHLNGPWDEAVPHL